MLRTNTDTRFGGQWSNSLKQGDVAWRPVDISPNAPANSGPTIVAETGWSEGVRQLQSERLWVVGFGDCVNGINDQVL
jgi:hypothetical protein